jgi:hypothetical protein
MRLLKVIEACGGRVLVILPGQYGTHHHYHILALMVTPSSPPEAKEV